MRYELADEMGEEAEEEGGRQETGEGRRGSCGMAYTSFISTTIVASTPPPPPRMCSLHSSVMSERERAVRGYLVDRDDLTVSS